MCEHAAAKNLGLVRERARNRDIAVVARGFLKATGRLWKTSLTITACARIYRFQIGYSAEAAGGDDSVGS
jgi:hypothetical protein